MEAHRPGDHVPGSLRECQQHGAGGFVILLHMVGAGFWAAQGCSAALRKTKLVIFGMLLAGMCTGGQQGVCPLVVCTPGHQLCWVSLGLVL